VATRSSPVRLTERDRLLLAFTAEHRLALAAHAAALLEVSARTADGRLNALAEVGYLSSSTIFHRQPACYQITRNGLAAIGSELRPPRCVDLGCYAHDVGVAWLWLAARAGRFGAAGAVLGERRLRSSDGRLERDGTPFGVRLGGVGAGGSERLHYPDLLLVTAAGRRVAFELELTPKGRARRETILAGYAADARIDGVLYLVLDGSSGRGIGRSVTASARRLDLSELIHVQHVRIPDAAEPARSDPGRGRALPRAQAIPAVGRAGEVGTRGAGR
jgi:hypothetical protein